MAKDNQILVRVNDPTNNAVEQFAEDRDYTKAEAVRRVLESRLRSEGYLAREHYGGGEPEPVADGGQVVRPMLNFLGALYASVSLTLFGVISLGAFGVLVLPFVDYGSLFGAMLSTFLLVAAVMVVLYTRVPEAIDRLLYTQIRRIRNWVPVSGVNP